MRPWSKIACCVLIPLANAGCVAAPVGGGVEEGDDGTAASAQVCGLDESAFFAAGGCGICPNLTPDDLMWPLCESLCGGFDDFGGYGFGGFGGYGFPGFGGGGGFGGLGGCGGFGQGGHWGGHCGGGGH